MAMKIGINGSFLRKPATGIGQVTLHFLETLSRTIEMMPDITKDWEFIVYVEEMPPSDCKLSSRFTIRILSSSMWHRDDLIRKVWWENFLLPRAIARDHCDSILSMYQSSTIVSKKVKHTMMVHDLIPKIFPEYLHNWRKKIYWRLVERAIRRADEIIAVSRKTEKDIIIRLGIDPQKISVHFIDVDPIFKKQLQSGTSSEVMRRHNLVPGYIYFGGGLEKRKNAEGVLRAYALLVQKKKRKILSFALPKLVISGKLIPQLAPLVTDVEQLVRDLNLMPYVCVTDFVAQEDMPFLYANAKIFVFPSLYEGFGLPVLEAMSQGTPVLTSRTTSLPEIAGDACAYCDPSDIASIAKEMEALLADVHQCSLLGKRGKERSLLFSWQRFTNEVIEKIRL